MDEITVSTASFIGAVLSVVFEKCAKNPKFFPETNAFQDEHLSWANAQIDNPPLGYLTQQQNKEISAWRTYITKKLNIKYPENFETIQADSLTTE